MCLSLISPMIPETSRELHLNLRDQSRLRSSLSRTCLTAPNTPCVHKACVRGDRRYTSAHHHLTLSLQEWPRSAAATTATSTSTATVPPLLPPPTVSRRHLHRHTYFPTRNCFCKNFLIGARVSKLFFFPSLTVHASVSAADPHADGEICHPLSLDELFLLHMAAALIPGCLRIFRDTTSTDFF